MLNKAVSGEPKSPERGIIVPVSDYKEDTAGYFIVLAEDYQGLPSGTHLFGKKEAYRDSGNGSDESWINWHIPKTPTSPNDDIWSPIDLNIDLKSIKTPFQMQLRARLAHQRELETRLGCNAYGEQLVAEDSLTGRTFTQEEWDRAYPR